MIGLNAVYDSLTILNNCLVSKDKNQYFIDNIELSPIEVIKNYDPISSLYISVTFKIQSELGIIFNRVGDISQKYDSIFIDTPCVIDSHTTDDTYDYITCSNISEILLDALAIEDMLIVIYLTDLVHLTSETFIMERFRPPKDCMFSGEYVNIKISTKNDPNRINLNAIKTQIFSIITENYRKFKIYDNGIEVGRYQLVSLPEIVDISEEDSIQSIHIKLTGYYLVRY